MQRLGYIIAYPLLMAIPLLLLLYLLSDFLFFMQVVEKVKRSYYILIPTFISDEPREESKEWILDQYINKLEHDIVGKPAF